MPSLIVEAESVYSCHAFDVTGSPLGSKFVKAPNAARAAELFFMNGGHQVHPDQIFSVAVIQDLQPQILVTRENAWKTIAALKRLLSWI